MNITIKEIASILRSTEPMADQFARRVQDRVGQPVSHEEVLIAMKKIAAKKLSIERVVTKVQEQKNRTKRKASQRRTTRTQQRAPRSASTTTRPPQKTTSNRKPKTVLERLDTILQGNWDRAEREGLQPDRTSAEEFINAVYNHTDRREASRQRILQAANKLDKDDILLTPALVADIVHQLFQG